MTSNSPARQFELRHPPPDPLVVLSSVSRTRRGSPAKVSDFGRETRAAPPAVVRSDAVIGSQKVFVTSGAKIRSAFVSHCA